MDFFFLLIVIVVFVLGIVTGGLSNLTSGGAGIFTIYVLTNYAGLVIQESTGTVLAASTIIVLVGAVSFYRKKQVDTQLAITVGLSGVVGAFLAARWASSIQSSTIEHAFGAFTLALAVYTGIRFLSEERRSRSKAKGFNAGTVSPLSPTGSIANSSALQDGGNAAVQTRQVSRWGGTDPLAICVQIAKGALIGVATGLFGVGLASLSIVLFLILFKLDMKMVLGTSLFASFFRYLGGSIGYATANQIDPFFFAIIVIGGAIGSIAGAKVVLGNGRGSKEVYVKLVIMAMLLFISYEFLLKAYIPIHIHI